MLMEPLPPADKRARLFSPRPSRRLQTMLAGSLLLHVLGLLAIWWVRPEPEAEPDPSASTEVAMVFESSGAKDASTQAPNATQPTSAPPGNVNATTAQPNPDTSPPPPPAPPTPAPPTPPVAAPAPPTPPAPPMQQVQPQQTPEAPPQPTEQPQPQPSPSQARRPPPTVSLRQDDEPALPPLPRFVPPVPPPPLPPMPPRPAAPRSYARPSPQNPFAAPQDWSLNTVPSPQQAPGRPSRGLDLSTGSLTGEKDATVGYVSGAKPSGNWIGALKAWVQARTYYPEEALVEQQQGPVTLQLVFDRSGKVLSYQLVRSSRSPFLDQGFLGEFRNATGPAFTPDMTDQTSTVIFTMNYVLIGRR